MTFGTIGININDEVFLESDILFKKRSSVIADISGLVENIEVTPNLQH